MLDLRSLIPFHHNRQSQQGDTPSDPSSDRSFAMRREMDHLFENIFSVGAVVPAETSWSPKLPNLEVIDGEKQLTITAELPGIDEKDVDLRISGDLLTIECEKSTEHESKEGERTYSERSYGKFSRTIRLPFSITDEKVHASYEKGVLNIELEKPAGQESKTEEIPIKTA